MHAWCGWMWKFMLARLQYFKVTVPSIRNKPLRLPVWSGSCILVLYPNVKLVVLKTTSSSMESFTIFWNSHVPSKLKKSLAFFYWIVARFFTEMSCNDSKSVYRFQVSETNHCVCTPFLQVGNFSSKISWKNFLKKLTCMVFCRYLMLHIYLYPCHTQLSRETWPSTRTMQCEKLVQFPTIKIQCSALNHLGVKNDEQSGRSFE